uniref:Uncharacterized protein n=1 Tax=Glossina austeni TaxID=7395 RepID=A0A1A9VPV9_GLOAU
MYLYVLKDLIKQNKEKSNKLQIQTVTSSQSKITRYSQTPIKTQQEMISDLVQMFWMTMYEIIYFYVNAIFNLILLLRLLLSLVVSVLTKGQGETARYRFLGKYGGYCWLVTQATIVYEKLKPHSVICVNYVIRFTADRVLESNSSGGFQLSQVIALNSDGVAQHSAQHSAQYSIDLTDIF